MNRRVAQGLAASMLALSAGIAQAHHEAASAVNGEGAFLLVAMAVIAAGVLILQPRG